ncbi:MAG: hypothetical protein GYB68_19330, partial [Chloroflexi bacterium]|nr:hypothetical protein [Chloroflexota bacterium]
AFNMLLAALISLYSQGLITIERAASQIDDVPGMRIWQTQRSRGPIYLVVALQSAQKADGALEQEIMRTLLAWDGLPRGRGWPQGAQLVDLIYHLFDDDVMHPEVFIVERVQEDALKRGILERVRADAQGIRRLLPGGGDAYLALHPDHQAALPIDREVISATLKNVAEDQPTLVKALRDAVKAAFAQRALPDPKQPSARP